MPIIQGEPKNAKKVTRKITCNWSFFDEIWVSYI